MSKHTIRTEVPTRGYLATFFIPAGSPLTLWSHLETLILQCCASLGAQIDHVGVGGNPFFERWLLVTLPTDHSVETLVDSVTRLGADFTQALLPSSVFQSGEPVITLTLTEDEYNLALHDPTGFSEGLQREPVYIADFSDDVQAQR